jgi:hypothetical protein
MLFLIIPFRDAKLVYGCDVEERKRCARKTRKRRISERALTTSAVASSYVDPHISKLNLRKTKVCCLLWLLFFILIFWFLVAQMGEKMNVYRILVGKPKGKRPLGRPRHRWVHNIKMDLREIGWGGVDWIDLADDRDQWRALMNTVMNLRVP